MCGILGGIYRDMRVPSSESIERALDLLQHRGPDAHGIATGSHHFLAHRRLAILDLDDRANQPMARDGLQISFNGEIYNYLHIRAQLEKRGMRFSTTSDTEVVLAAYRRDGLACLDYLEGMFAFAIWDEAERSLILVRDRFGEKPLVYFSDEERLVFSSEIAPIEKLVGNGKLQLDPQSIGLYFLFSYIPAPYSPYHGVHQLGPGQWLKIKVDGWRVDTGRYYVLRDIPRAAPLAFDAAATTLREQLTKSVRDRLSASDVPVAVFLSGGIDSSVIAALAARAATNSIRAYSVSFPEDPGFDESGYAREVAARHPNMRHIVIPVVERELIEFTDATLGRLSEPYADASLIPTAYLCSHVEEKVALGGDGADELFGGYGVYAAMRASARLPAWLKRLLLQTPAGDNPHAIRYAPLRALALFRQHLNLNSVDEYLSWRCYKSAEWVRALGLNTERLATVRDGLAGLEGATLRDILIKDMEFNLPNDMLKKVDLASMFHSLEVRLPYLDRRVVEFALSQPDTYHMHRFSRKRLLRRAFADILPDSVKRRRKQGFLLPLRRWFRDGRLGTELSALIDEQTLLDRPTLRAIAGQHRSGRHDHSVLLWELYVYLKWIQGRALNMYGATTAARH